jgi:hypothetical protein
MYGVKSADGLAVAWMSAEICGRLSVVSTDYNVDGNLSDRLVFGNVGLVPQDASLHLQIACTGPSCASP